MTQEELRAEAVKICASQGIVCPDPGNHVLRSDGHAGHHAWVIQAIKDAKHELDNTITPVLV